MAHDYDRTKTAASEEPLNKFLDHISSKAYDTLRSVDEKFVGTPDYMGLAYFWSMAYKFSLREAPAHKRRAVHQAFLKAGLPVNGESPAHEAIVAKLVGL